MRIARLTRASTYALHALVYLAQEGEGKLVASHLIARACGITTIPAGLSLKKPEDRLSFLPAGLRRFRAGDFFCRMWLAFARRPRSLPLAVFLKRFLAPEWVFILGMAGSA